MLNEKNRYIYNVHRDPTMLLKGPNQIIPHFYNKLAVAIAANKNKKEKEEQESRYHMQFSDIRCFLTRFLNNTKEAMFSISAFKQFQKVGPLNSSVFFLQLV